MQVVKVRVLAIGGIPVVFVVVAVVYVDSELISASDFGVFLSLEVVCRV